MCVFTYRNARFFRFSNTLSFRDIIAFEVKRLEKKDHTISETINQISLILD